jgi:hypothetical protein
MDGEVFAGHSGPLSLIQLPPRHEDWDLYAAEIQDKTAAEVKSYYQIFKKKWKQLAGMRN